MVKSKIGKGIGIEGLIVRGVDFGLAVAYSGACLRLWLSALDMGFVEYCAHKVACQLRLDARLAKWSSSERKSHPACATASSRFLNEKEGLVTASKAISRSEHSAPLLWV